MPTRAKQGKEGYPMASTVADRLLEGGDFSLYLSPQAAKDAVNSAPEFYKVRRTSGKNATAVSYTTSNEVSTDGQAPEQIQESKSYTLDFETEGYSRTIEQMIAAIYGEEVVRTDTDTVYAATATGFTSTGGELGALGLAVGDYFFVDGFATADLNRSYRVSAVDDSDTITTYPAPSAAESAGASVTMLSRKTVSAVSPTYFTSQTRATDFSKAGDLDYNTHYNGIINTYALTIPEEGVCTATASLICEKHLAGTAAIAAQTDAAADTGNAFSSAQHVKDFFVQGVSKACEVKSMSIEIANNQQEDSAAGCQGKLTARGQFGCSGSVSVRSFASSPFTFRDYNENGTNVELGLRITDGDGQSTVIVIESAKITEATQADGNSVIANAECSFAAQRHSTTGTTVKIYRDWA